MLLADVGRWDDHIRRAGGMHHLNAEPQTAIGCGSGISDIDWMRKVTGVRAAAQEAGSPPAVPAAVRLLADLLVSAGEAGTPVLLDGVVGAAAATVAEELPPFRHRFWARNRHRLFLDHLNLAAWTTGGIGPGQGWALWAVWRPERGPPSRGRVGDEGHFHDLRRQPPPRTSISTWSSTFTDVRTRASAIPVFSVGENVPLVV